MSGRVSISRRAARLLLGMLGVARLHPYETDAVDELKAALAPKKAKPWATAKKLKAAKHKAKRDETAEIRAAVMKRAELGTASNISGPLCEVCRVWRASDMHHAFGRVRVRQSVTNCVAVCRRCHDRIGRNEPNAFECWRELFHHFRRNGYGAEAAQAEKNAAKAAYRADPTAEVSP
jgi:5-methylcytosine-specific restriction endonuclease McrA